ncbi:MAG: aminotransferase class IV, partial [Gammaproteobacteria bacterium]|nr:aminotransferase class IV [Gammaproteobacteria bacterium]
MSTAWLNGRFLPLADAHVSVLDRGFLFGDGIYEVIPVYGGRLFRLPQHLKRLRNSLDGVRITNPMNDSEWETMLHELVTRNEGSDQAIYLQVTRGVAPKRDHAFPTGIQPTVFCMSNVLT